MGELTKIFVPCREEKPDGDAECAHVGCNEETFRVNCRRLWCRDHVDKIEKLRRADTLFLSCGCGPEPCEDCADHLNSNLRILLVGERFNASPWEWTTEQSMNLEFLVRKGSFLWGPARARLLRCGLRWDAALNLLPPSRLLGTWDAKRARMVAENIKNDILKRYDAVYLVGKRVCEAFRPDLTPGGPWIETKHPSGRSRLWNAHDAEAIVRAETRSKLSKLIKRIESK